MSSRIDVVDELLMGFMRSYLAELKLTVRSGKADGKRPDNRARILQAELTKLTNQRGRLCDYLEQGIYDTGTYLSRAKLLSVKIEDCSRRLAALEAEQEAHIPPREMIIRLRHVLERFYLTEDATGRNELLKTVVRRITYDKTIRMCNNKRDGDIALQVAFL